LRIVRYFVAAILCVVKQPAATRHRAIAGPGTSSTCNMETRFPRPRSSVVHGQAKLASVGGAVSPRGAGKLIDLSNELGHAGLMDVAHAHPPMNLAVNQPGTGRFGGKVVLRQGGARFPVRCAGIQHRRRVLLNGRLSPRSATWEITEIWRGPHPVAVRKGPIEQGWFHGAGTVIASGKIKIGRSADSSTKHSRRPAGARLFVTSFRIHRDADTPTKVRKGRVHPNIFFGAR